MKSLLSFMTFSRLLRQIQCGVWKSAGKRPSNAVAIVLAKMPFALMVVVAGTTPNPSWGYSARPGKVSEPTVERKTGDSAGYF